MLWYSIFTIYVEAEESTSLSWSSSGFKEDFFL